MQHNKPENIKNERLKFAELINNHHKSRIVEFMAKTLISNENKKKFFEFNISNPDLDAYLLTNPKSLVLHIFILMSTTFINYMVLTQENLSQMNNTQADILNNLLSQMNQLLPPKNYLLICREKGKESNLDSPQTLFPDIKIMSTYKYYTVDSN